MARIRSVKPELFKHDELYDAEAATGLPLRLTFIGLFTVADREGRFKWKPRIIKLDVLPYDDVDFEQVLNALVESGFLIKYEVNGAFYGCIPSFSNHQAINNKESDSQLPSPPNAIPETNSCEVETIDAETRDINACHETELADSRVTDACLTREARVDDASPTPLFLAQGEGKGKEKEGKGTGREKEQEGNGKGNNAQVREVFSHWQVVFNHTRTKLDKTRSSKISARLRSGFTPEELKTAINGCRASPFHQGQNDTGAIHDGIELIFRNDDKTRYFISLAQASQRTPGNVSPITRHNMQAADEAERLIFGGGQ